MDERLRIHVWEAFCTLSDAQEHSPGPSTANDLVNHAKRHLMEVLEEGGVPLGLIATCSLDEGLEHTAASSRYQGLLEAAQGILNRLHDKGTEKEERERLLEMVQGLVPGWQPTELGG